MGLSFTFECGECGSHFESENPKMRWSQSGKSRIGEAVCVDCDKEDSEKPLPSGDSRV